MIIWCAYCQQFQGEKAPFDNYSITHGVCPACKPQGGDLTDQQFERVQELKKLQDSLFKAGIKQDISSAEKAIEAAQNSGARLLDIFMGVITPALWRIGDLWAAGSITTEEEQRFTSFYNAILNKLEHSSPIAPRYEEAPVAEVALMNSPGNIHNLGIKVLDLWLQSKGVRSALLPENAAFEEIIAQLELIKPRYLVISAAIQTQIPGALQFCHSLRAALGMQCPQILLGGNAVKKEAQIAQDGVIVISDVHQFYSMLQPDAQQ